MCYRVFLPLLCLVLSAPTVAQPVSDSLRADSSTVDGTLQRLLDERPDDKTPARLVERLTRLSSDPIDVNRASASTLSSLPTLAPALAHRIVRRRVQDGPFADLGDVASVDGLDRSRIRLLHPYLVVKPTENEAPGTPYPSPPSLGTITSNLSAEFVQRATRRIDTPRGFSNDSSQTTFRGSPFRLTTRFRVHHERRIEAAFTGDKDPGEALRWSPERNTYGFDHVAGHLAARDLGRIQTFVVGDFTAQFGQGLALWQGLTFGKGRDPVSPLVREGRGIVPFNSTQEDEYFRGVATTVSITPSLSLSGFASRRARDASLDSSATDNRSPPAVPARTISTGGLHRTDSEIAKKGTLGTTTVGGAMSYRTGSVDVGASGYYSKFDRPLRPGDRPFRQFDVAGTDSYMASLYGSSYFEDYVLFGEAARAENGTVGLLAGAALDHESGVEAILLGRRYPPNFPVLFGGSFGDSGSPQNEVGIYTGVRVQISENWWIGGYVDQYRFPWLQFGVPRPTTGWESRLVLETTPRPWLSSYVQFRVQQDPAGTDRPGPHGRLLDGVETQTRHAARWHVEYEFSDRLTLRSRIETTRFTTENAAASYGFLLYQGLTVTPIQPLDVNARVSLFDTDGFASRIFAYEHDLLYSFSVPALFGRGQRSYLHLRYRPTSSLTFEMKYGVTWHPNERTTGSGPDRRETNQTRDIRAQIRWTI